MISHLRNAALALLLTAGASTAATVATLDSPTSKGELPSGVSVIGGVVLDLIGLNGTRVVSQTAASSLFVGFNGPGDTLNFGSQSGFDAGVISALGGGISELSVRITLFDGDTSASNFDDGDNTLEVNGVEIGNFSDVVTQVTDANGAVEQADVLGFSNNELNTGFFFTDDATALSAIFASLGATETALFSLVDVDPGDNFFDFKQGIDGGLIDVGTGPVVSPVPVPAALPLLLTAFAAMGAVGMRRRKS